MTCVGDKGSKVLSEQAVGSFSGFLNEKKNNGEQDSLHMAIVLSLQCAGDIVGSAQTFCCCTAFCDAGPYNVTAQSVPVQISLGMM